MHARIFHCAICLDWRLGPNAHQIVRRQGWRALQIQAPADFPKPVWPRGFDPPAGVGASLEKGGWNAALLGSSLSRISTF